MIETKPQSFIIKIWLEEAEEGTPAAWRGHITHVPSGERRYLKELGDIAVIIKPYLELIGARLGDTDHMTGASKQ